MKKQDKITGKNIYELDIKNSKQWSNNVHETQEKNTEIQWGLQPKIKRGAWHALVYGVSRNQTWLSNWIELNWFKMKPESSSQMFETI